MGRISANKERNLSIPTTIGRIRSPDRWTSYFFLRFASTKKKIIQQGKLAELLENVKKKLMECLKEYELAMTEIHQYYDLPLVSYSYTENMLVLQIPIYVKLPTTNTGNV